MAVLAFHTVPAMSTRNLCMAMVIVATVPATIVATSILLCLVPVDGSGMLAEVVAVVALVQMERSIHRNPCIQTFVAEED